MLTPSDARWLSDLAKKTSPTTSRFVRLENECVPRCIPGRYGDYIEFKIDGDGTLLDWKPNAAKVAKSFDEHE